MTDIKEIVALQDQVEDWRKKYFNLGFELGDIINNQQDIILSLKAKNQELSRENWNLRQTKKRKR